MLYLGRAILLLGVLHLSICTNLHEQLNSIPFFNSGTVSNTDIYEYVTQCAIYTEAQNITAAEWSWATWGPYSYLFQRNTSASGVGSQCVASEMNTDTDMMGDDYQAIVMPYFDPNLCQEACCNDINCRAWVFGVSPLQFFNCTNGSYCCFMKDLIPAPSPHKGLYSGTVNHNIYNAPPIGMRSAVPLGGLGTGSFEIRADGSFHEFTIMNQSPAGSAKQQTMDEAVFGVWTSTGGAVMLRTQPPNGPTSYPGIQSMTYSGSFPVSKLDLNDNRLGGLKMSLFAYPEFHIGNYSLSSTPAAIFSLNVENPTNSSVDVSFMFNLPYGKEPDTNRTAFFASKSQKNNPKNMKIVQVSHGYPSCFEACSIDDDCVSWSWDGHNCLIMDSVPSSVWNPGQYSGVKGNWNSFKKPAMLVLDRPGFSPASGNISLLALNPDSTYSSTFSIANDLSSIWSLFAKNGVLSNQSISGGSGMHGAASVKTTLQPGQSKTLTIIFGWYFPYRDHLNEVVGNFYTNNYYDATDVVQKVASRMPSIVSDIGMYHQLFANTTLPVWLKDILINSFSHLRNAIFTQDGRWRQWETFDCNDIDSVHNDMQRQLPYVLFFPELEMNKMKAWAAGQATNGMIQETLGENTCVYQTYDPLDTPGGREMADVTSMFVTEIYQLYKWTGDSQFLELMYPTAREGAIWQINVSQQYGLPSYMIDTYDIINLAQYKLASFNGFLHLTAMLVCEELATIKNDSSLLSACIEALNLGQATIFQSLWNGKYFSAYNGGKAVMGDTLYGQLWAYTLGLGNAVENDYFLKSHLKAELQYNDSPYGLLVLTSNDGKLPPKMPINQPTFGPFDGCNGVIYGDAFYNNIWMGGSPDWASLAIHLGEDVNQSLAQAEKALNHWREGLNDLWNIHGIVAGEGFGYDGLPWCTSHYGFHMVLWHIPFALSGQDYSAPAQMLTFDPKVEAPYKLPILIPHVYGHISCNSNGVYTLEIIGGQITLKHVAVSGIAYGKVPVTLNAGSSITWQ